MSMSGRISTDQGPGTVWNYGALPTYAPDVPNGHGRRSSIYRQQNSTLFSAFEEEEEGEEGMAMEDLDSEDGRGGRSLDKPNTARQGAGYETEGRSLIVKKTGGR